MAVTATAVFGQTPFCETARVTNGFGTMSAPTAANLTLLVPMATNGVFVTGIWAAALATNVSCQLAIFKSSDGSNFQHVDSIQAAAQTINSSVAPTVNNFSKWSETTPLRVGSTFALYAGISQTNASGFDFGATGMKY